MDRLKLSPPVAARKPHKITEHGTEWEDPWFWLRFREEDKEVLPYLHAENAYTQSVLEPTKALQEKLYKEMRGRIVEKDASVPEKDGPYFYYRRFEEGGQYPIFCRKRGEAGDEEVLLDVNPLAEGKKFLDLGVFELSPDHNKLAYSIDTDGSERYTVYIKDLLTGDLFPETIPHTYDSLVWAEDNEYFFYTLLDAHLRPSSVYRHRLGAKNGDTLVYQETDPKFFLSLSRSLSHQYLFLQAQGSHVSEIHFLSTSEPNGKFTLVQKRTEGVEYSVVHHGDRFFILSNADEAKDYAVFETPVTAPSKANWKPYIPHQPGCLLESVEAFEKYLVLELRENGLPKIRIQDLSSQQFHDIGFEEPTYEVDTGGYREFASDILRFTYSGLCTPSSVFDYHMSSRGRECRKTIEVPGFDSSQYKIRREFATAADGTKVPISLCFHQNTPLDGSAPLYLYAYGSYGLSRSAGFSSSRVSLLDRGFVYALAHIRGGMEMGWDWYEKGRRLHKKNTFSDYISCAEHLIEKKYTSSGKVTACGGSAGGMLMGVVANEAPQLFSTVIAHVPFVDVLNTMLDADLPLTPIEFSEWGNPKDKTYFDYIRSYSPYDNVKAQAYPHIFVFAGLNDPRVTYWEPAKWVAKLRNLKTDSNHLLLKTNMGAGHGGASGRFEYLREVAEEYAFILLVTKNSAS